jgi:outer membrane protein assembly factor BamB
VDSLEPRQVRAAPPDEQVIGAATSGPTADQDEPPSDLRTRRTGSDWPQFLGPTGDGKSPETGIRTDWPEEGLPIVWQRDLGEGYGMPTVSRGRLFQFDRIGDEARLVCLESETGRELWQFKYPTDYTDLYGYSGGPRCSPVVDGNRVYLFGAEGMLHCVRAADGKPLWRVDTAEQFGVVQNFFGVGSTPVIEGDLLIAQIGGSPMESQSVPPGALDQVVGNRSGIVAFDKRTGAVRYQITDELAGYSGPVLATINGRRWCFVFARGGLVGFDPADGKVDFHYPWRARILESVNASNPVVVDDTVLISETYGPGSSLLRVRPGGYDVVWADPARSRTKSLMTHWNTPIHVGGFVYGSSGRHSPDAELRCIELATGKKRWSVPGLSRSSLLYVDGHFVCLTEYGTLMLIKVNPDRFELVAEVTMRAAENGPSAPGGSVRRLLEYPAWAAPILSHGLLYVRGKDRLVCLELIPR